MITYVYVVKCPNCEDEFFDFFDEAKDFAMGCLSNKPVITQTEVHRNDFGECTDHYDLGTQWSWEDECQTEEEPAVTVFSKDDLKNIPVENDPEFDYDDSDFRFINEEFLESRRISFNNKADQQEFFKLCKETGMITAADLDRFMKDYNVDDGNLLDMLRAYRDELNNPIDESLTEAKRDPFHEAIFEAIEYLTEFNDIFPVPDNIGATSWDELKDDIRYGLSSDFEIAEIIMEYLDKDLAIGRKHPEIFEDDPQSELTLETYNRLKRAYDRAVAAYEAAHPEDFKESCERKPIPEGMTIEELVEAMEENEDTVECSKCNELFSKEQCVREEGHGWICPSCGSAPLAEDMSEGTYETYDPKEKIEFDYSNLSTTVAGNQRDVDDWDEAEYVGDYTYTATADEVATAIWENCITEEDIKEVPGGLDYLYENDDAWQEFLKTNFWVLYEKYYYELCKYFRSYAQSAFEDNATWDDYKEAQASYWW